MSTDPKSWGEGTEVQSNWFKFNKVGDGVKGTLISRRLQPSTDAAFPDQHVYELQSEDGNNYNVGISVKKAGTVQRLNACKIGEIVGILFEKEIPTDKKGFRPAKALKVMTFGMDPSYKALEEATEKIPFIN